MDLFFQQDILSQRLFLSPFVKGIYDLLNWPNLCYLIKVDELIKCTITSMNKIPSQANYFFSQ